MKTLRVSWFSFLCLSSFTTAHAVLISAGKEVMPYLPDLMSHLLAVLKGCSAIRPRELAITAIGAVGKSFCLVGCLLDNITLPLQLI